MLRSGLIYGTALGARLPGRIYISLVSRYATQVAQLKIVTPSIDGPNRFLVIRFEHEGERRFARWLGGDEWRGTQLLHRLFAEAEV